MSHGFEPCTVLLFILFSFVEFYKCIFEANVIHFEIFKTVVAIMFYESLILVNIAKGPIPP